jgi:hypothetical protein
MEMKNYIGFVNDHSQSMRHIRNAAMADYNTNITAIKEAATREMLDTVVSVVGIGLVDGAYGAGSGVKRQVVISNPHVLKPLTEWPTPGVKPLYDGTGDIIELFDSLPDANEEHVSFLVMVTTDGEEYRSSRYTASSLKCKIEERQRTGRWTFVFRVPKDKRSTVSNLGVPADNIQEWDTSNDGMQKSTAVTTAAMNTYFTTRAAGSKSSTTFYSNASQVNVSALKDITKDVSLYVVPDNKMGVEIKDFILTKRQQYLKGAAFYQLTKTEARVQHDKLILVRDKATGKIYGGDEARQMVGLPKGTNARLHPGDHGSYDIFIQSQSTNRKLVAGTGVVYWEAVGVPFTDSDFNYSKPKTVNGIVQLPTVAPTNKPTANPIPKAPKPVAARLSPSVGGKPVLFFVTREEARKAGKISGKSPRDLLGSIEPVTGSGGRRWYIFV